MGSIHPARSHKRNANWVHYAHMGLSLRSFVKRNLTPAQSTSEVARTPLGPTKANFHVLWHTHIALIMSLHTFYKCFQRTMRHPKNVLVCIRKS